MRQFIPWKLGFKHKLYFFQMQATGMNKGKTAQDLMSHRQFNVCVFFFSFILFVCFFMSQFKSPSGYKLCLWKEDSQSSRVYFVPPFSPKARCMHTYLQNF